jgi:hypothetical protein
MPKPGGIKVRPLDPKLDEYREVRAALGKRMTELIEEADEPAVVAQTVLAVHPKLRYAPGGRASRLRLLRRFAPGGLADTGIRRNQQLDAPTASRPRPPSRSLVVSARAILEKPVSNPRHIERCYTIRPFQIAVGSQVIDSKDGEMSEWLKEHAWKAKWPTVTEQHRNTALRNRFNDLPSQDAPRCDSVKVGILRRFRPHLTQFLHNAPGSGPTGAVSVPYAQRSIRPQRRSWNLAAVTRAHRCLTPAGWHGDNPRS